MQCILMLCCLLLLTLRTQCRRWPERSYDKRDNMGRYDKIRMQRLAIDLVRNSKLKMRQIMIHVHTQTKKEGFHYGVVIGKMREIYRNMIDFYRSALHNVNGTDFSVNSILLTPRVWQIRPVDYILYMDMIHEMAVRIDTMVDTIEYMPKYADIWDPRKREFSKPLPKAIDEEDQTKMALRQKEETLKSRYREQFLMKRIGLSANTSTTSKRFMHKWPVEETWKLNDSY